MIKTSLIWKHIRSTRFQALTYDAPELTIRDAMANLKTVKIEFQKGVSSTSETKERVSLQTIIHTAKTQYTFKYYT
jgi:hypothetical protein